MAEGAPPPLNINTSPYIEISQIHLRFYFQHGVVLLINPSDPNSSLALNLTTNQVSLLNGHPIETEPIKITGEGLHEIFLFRSVGILLMPSIGQIIHLSRNAIQLQPHDLPFGFQSDLPFEINGAILTIGNPYYISINLQTGESMPLVPVAEAPGAAGGAAGGAGGSPVPEIPRGMVTEEDDKRFIQLLTYANTVIIPQSNEVIRVLNDFRHSRLILENSRIVEEKYKIIQQINAFLERQPFYNVNAKTKYGLESIIEDFITKLKAFQKSLNEKRLRGTLADAYFMSLEELKRTIIGVIPNIKDELKDTGKLRENITQKYAQLLEKKRLEEEKNRQALLDETILSRGNINTAEYKAARARTIQRRRNMEAAAAADLAKAEANAAAQLRGSQNNSMGQGSQSQNFLPMNVSNSLPSVANNLGAAGGAPAAPPAPPAAPPLAEVLPIQLPLGVPPEVLAAAAASAAAAGGNAGAAAGGAAGGNGGAAAGGWGPPPAAAARVFGNVGPENLGGENNGGRTPPFVAAANGNAGAAPVAGNAGGAARPATPPFVPAANGNARAAAVGNAGGAPRAKSPPFAPAANGNARAAAAAGNAGGAGGEAPPAAAPPVLEITKEVAEDKKREALELYEEHKDHVKDDARVIKAHKDATSKTIKLATTIYNRAETLINVIYEVLGEEPNNQGGGRRRARSSVLRRKTLKRKSHKSSKKTRGRK
jgi:hypothetical protein